MPLPELVSAAGSSVVFSIERVIDSVAAPLTLDPLQATLVACAVKEPNSLFGSRQSLATGGGALSIVVPQPASAAATAATPPTSAARAICIASLPRSARPRARKGY